MGNITPTLSAQWKGGSANFLVLEFLVYRASELMECRC
jgi:hypothetical protein